jgi:Raf kinase inhibitor-like YbhB/YbcL family protein
MRYIMTMILSTLVTTAMAADFTIQSTAFSNNKRIPILYTCNGKNISPDLSWTNAPANTKSFALILSCPDAPVGLFYNWVVFNIPENTTTLAQSDKDNFPEEAVIGNNSIGDAIYRGPCPPDADLHHYVFTLYALDISLDLAQGSEADDVYNAMKHHILKEAQLTGLYSH